MNALNILSGRSPPSPPRSRTSSVGNIHTSKHAAGLSPTSEKATMPPVSDSEGDSTESQSTDEKTPLLMNDAQLKQEAEKDTHTWRLLPQRITDIIMSSVRVVFTTITAPARYVVACFYDENGRFSAILPIRSIFRVSSRDRRQRVTGEQEVRHKSVQGSSSDEDLHVSSGKRRKASEVKHPTLRPTTELGQDDAQSQSSSDEAHQHSAPEDSPAGNTRSKSAAQDEGVPTKRSIRIKLHNETGQKRKHRSLKSVDETATEEDRLAAVANSLKSPSSTTSTAKVKYPRAPAPPRPLIPRRQPSYVMTFSPEAPKKTLVIDLDETLIHSMAKGGRMSTGHMVEVKIQGPIGGNGVVLGPQVPILYFVHERPHCHEFLRKVSKWYNLVAFTASVQEYADPVVDWLERERRYFSARYYRQHCTFRNGAYIKDLSHVEPDLSRVMILDNSPMSYIFHEDNAIPIEGWISDPTDSDLLHLIPLLEGLQYATDVRALLALRLGQTERT